MKRTALWVVIYIICGIYFRLGRSEMICLVFFVFSAASAVRFAVKTKNPGYLLFLLFVVCGFLMAGHSAEREMADVYLKGSTEGIGVITEEGKTSSDNRKYRICCDLQDENGISRQDVELYVIWTGEETFAVGDRVSVKGELRPFYQASLPGGYDEELYLRTKGYDGKMYPESMEYLGKETSVTVVLAEARNRLHQTLDEILPETESGIMKAMLTGDKEDIPDEIYRLYAKTGIVHVLCISGLHMSILALYVSFFAERILKQSRRVSAALTMAASLLFLMFVGFTPSAVRAVTMISVVMTARIIFRSHDRLNEIALAALLILCVEPMYLFHIGFQLSFITVLGLCIAAEQMERKRIGERTWKDSIKESLRFSLYASLCSFPMAAYYFYYISPSGILANLIVVPLSGILLGFGILCSILGTLWTPLGVFAAGSVYGILKLFELICNGFLHLPFSYIPTGRPSESVILLSYGLLFFWLKCRCRKNSWKGMICLCAVLFCAVFANQLFRKETTVAFLDVGQGDAAVIHTWDGQTYLVDGGGRYGKDFGENVGMTVVLPYLEYLGVTEVDAAFLSHPDSDHMTGLLEILEEMPVKEIILAEYPYAVTKEMDFLKEMLEKYPTKLYTVDNRDGSSDKGWDCLAPVEEIIFAAGDDNDGSMVLKYSEGGTEVLFTGDISVEAERMLLQEGADVSADILKVSHHGSQYSSGEAFLKATGAKAAVISCGENNLYGHPHKATMERLQAADMEIYRTDTEGSIFLKIRENGAFKIETMAERMPLYERIEEKLEKR